MAIDELGWLVGEWTDDWRRGEPGLSTAGGESWSPQLGGQILVRTCWCEYPATAAEPAFRHDDLLVVFRDFDGQHRVIFWDNHGHVIRYATAAFDPDQLGFTLESDPSVPGPRQRLHYRPLYLNGFFFRHNFLFYTRVRISALSAVTATVCSKWAARLPSAVETNQ